MTTHAASVRKRLAEGPPRGLGCVSEIVTGALASPTILKQLVETLGDENPTVTTRAANALYKVQRVRPEVVSPYGHEILRTAFRCTDLRTRWNLTLVVGRLPLRGRDRALAIELMFEALGSGSGFLRAFALTGLVQFANENAALKKRVRPIVEKALTDPSAAVRARARKLRPGLQ